jgi:hypothetical protein
MTNIQENIGALPNKEDFVLITDESVRNKVNAQLEYVTANDFLTPYSGLEAIRKILTYYNIFVPNTMFLEKTTGYDIFPANQFGEKVGMNDDGEVVTAAPSPFSIYFEWKLNDDGKYDIFCSIVTEDELDELLEDSDEDEEEEMNEEKKTPFDGPYSKTVAPKSEKKKHNEVAKLARRAIKKVKKKLKEDYDHSSKQNAEDAKAISKSFRKKDKPEAKAWRQATKKLYNKAVTGLPQKKVKGLKGVEMHEENLQELKKETVKRAADKAFNKFYAKYDDATAARGKYIKSKNAPEHKPEFERTEKELRKAGRQMVRFSKYAEKLEEGNAKSNSPVYPKVSVNQHLNKFYEGLPKPSGKKIVKKKKK